MYLKAVKYKDTYLAPGSEAMALYQDKKFQALDEHLARLEKAKRKLEGESE